MAKKINPAIMLARFFLDCAAKAKDGPLAAFFVTAARQALK
jgi:hypothetical protein